MIDGDLGTATGRSDLVHLALRLIVEEALEGEVADAVGRERYERAEGAAAGYRNGYRHGKIRTAEGMVEYAAPQVRDTPEPFVSAIRAALGGRTEALEQLAVELYARGLSTRDIEDAFTDEGGRRLLSRAAVSEITERLWTEYEGFSRRDLSEHGIVYLFVDGIAERLRPGQSREAVLAAWGIGEDGRKVLLELMAGSKEDTETVRAFFQDMRGRGLGDPAARRLGRCSRDHPGDRGVLPALGPATLPRASDEEPRREGPDRPVARVQGARDGLLPGALAGHRARPRCWHSRRSCRQRCRARSPVSRTTSKPASRICGLPVTHRRSTRTTNLLERLFVEERRRLKIIPNGFGEKPVLKLMFGALVRAAERWRGLPLHRVRASSDRGRPPGPRLRIRGNHHHDRQGHPSRAFPAETRLDQV